MTTKPISVVVIDDQRMFGEGLARVLSDEDIEVVGVALNGADGVALALSHRPDVVLVDYQMPDQDGIAVTLELRRQVPSCAVVMLTGSHDDRTMLSAIDAGCCGFLTKSRSGVEVASAVRAAAAGESVISQELLARLLPKIGRAERGIGSDLTAREREVLIRLSRGLGNKAIAAELHLSVNTVRNYVQSTLMKLGAHSKLEAVAAAIREGVISYPA